MKQWSVNHPKAQLMARKRAAILEAAKNSFLTYGFDGTSMESIANAAGVSVMTLYRHVNNKEDLFSFVILGACDYSTGHKSAEYDALIQLTVPDALILIGEKFLEKLMHPETISLLRIVMVEAVRFPKLAKAAYDGYIDAWQINIVSYLKKQQQFREMSDNDIYNIVTEFISDLIGTDILKVLMGLTVNEITFHKERAKEASIKLLINS